MKTACKLIERIIVICSPEERNDVYNSYMDAVWVSTIPVADNGKIQVLQITFERKIANVSAEEYLRRS